jgi:hypothetical protein
MKDRLDNLLDERRPLGRPSVLDRLAAADPSDPLVQERDEFLARRPPEVFASSVAARIRAAARPAATWHAPRWLPWAAAAAVAVLAVVLLTPRAVDHGVRPKGTAVPAGEQRRLPEVALSFFSRTPEGAAPGVTGGAYRAGDWLRFVYTSGDNDFMFLFGVDDLGRVTAYYPDGGDESVPVLRGRWVPLEGSVVLDSYRGDERFFAMFSREPLTRDQIEEAARRALSEARRSGGGIARVERLPIECDQASVLIVKR